MLKQADFDTDKKVIREAKKRIRKALKEATEVGCRADDAIYNGAHTIRFKFSSDNVAIEGKAVIRDA